MYVCRNEEGAGKEGGRERERERKRGEKKAGRRGRMSAFDEEARKLNDSVREADELLQRSVGAKAEAIHVPVIDISSFVRGEASHGQMEELDVERRVCVDKMRAACKELGVFALHGHGIPELTISDAFHTASRFFAFASVSEKDSVASSSDTHGYVGSASMARVYGRGERLDKRECFCVGPEGFEHKRNVFPTTSGDLWSAADLHRHTIQFHTAAGDLANVLCHVISLALSVEKKDVAVGGDWMSRAIGKNESLCCFNYYSSEGSNDVDTGEEFPAHTDWAAFTILTIRRGSDGLEVIVDGKWRSLTTNNTAHLEEEFIILVNVADFLSRWSNGAFSSPIHRVKRLHRQRTDEPRLSIAYFVGGVINPLEDVACAPVLAQGEIPRYDAISIRDYLQRNYDNTLGVRA